MEFFRTLTPLGQTQSSLDEDFLATVLTRNDWLYDSQWFARFNSPGVKFRDVTVIWSFQTGL